MTGELWVCGDTHGRPQDTRKLGVRHFPEGKLLSKEDVVVQLGDFGWVWYPEGENPEQEYWLDWLTEKPFTIAVVLGNHENYDIIDNLPYTRKWGNPVKVIQRKKGEIYILERGQVYNINGRSIFTCGGATSQDKEYRKIAVDWWPQEQLTYKEERKALDQLDSIKWKVDYVFTHTCPARVLLDFFDMNTEGIYDGLSRTRDPVSVFLDFIDNRLEFKEWHFGHLHKDHRLIDDGGDIYQCHYNRMYQLN